MNFSDLQKKQSFKSKVIARGEQFNKKHKTVRNLGLTYAVIAIACYDFLFYFYSNAKRFTALACIILFFVVSSSFAYPALSANISFESDGEKVAGQTEAVAPEIISAIEVAESEAELAAVEDVDQAVMAEVNEKVNPDVAEIDNMVSVTEILDLDPASENAEDASSVDVEEQTEEEEQVQKEEQAGEEEQEASKEQEKPEEKEVTKEQQESEDNVATDEEPVFESDDWNILLVNKQHPIPDDYEFTLGTISGGMKCDERILEPLLDMLRAAREDGVNLIVCSPYRDMDRQTMLFSNKINQYMDGGMSYMDAYTNASQAVTVPGSSEHQIGLAVDIITKGYTVLDEGFGETPAGKWLSENSSSYGFILRYPAGKEEITSIEYEPWHFRYVGLDAASVIADNDLCLEEFWKIYVD